jgi:hypothetical protein
MMERHHLQRLVSGRRAGPARVARARKPTCVWLNEPPMNPPETSRRVRFDRNELSGAFGDLGTDFPLVVGMVLAAGLDVTSVLVMSGLMQILTGLAYGLPMPVQPLKAMAVIVITQKLAPGVLFGGGLAIGVVMLLLAVTGAVDWLAAVVPRAVVRGIQLGLGLQLAQLALRDYVPSEGAAGYALAGAAFVLTLFLLGSRRYPPATLVILLGVAYALLVRVDSTSWDGAFGLRLPTPVVPTWPDVATGFLVLAIPQLPLSLANSVLGTRQVLADLFPERGVGVRRISFTYSLMNLVNPFFGGIPTCHGAGGLAGHYAFGARTGGSVMIEGALYAGLGLFLSGGFATVILLFPKPVLGIILLFEALTLLRLTRDVAGSTADFSVALLVGVIALALPYGYAVGLVVGTLVAAAARRGITAFGRGDAGGGDREAQR